MGLGWLLRVYLLDNKFIIILFSIIKLGFVRTKSRGFSGISIVFGIHKLECQINLSLVKTIQREFRDYETGKA